MNGDEAVPLAGWLTVGIAIAALLFRYPFRFMRGLVLLVSAPFRAFGVGDRIVPLIPRQMRHLYEHQSEDDVLSGLGGSLWLQQRTLVRAFAAFIALATIAVSITYVVLVLFGNAD